MKTQRTPYSHQWASLLPLCSRPWALAQTTGRQPWAYLPVSLPKKWWLAHWTRSTPQGLEIRCHHPRLFQAAFASVPDNLLGLTDQLGDPLGLDLGDLQDLDSQVDSQNVQISTVQAMQNLFDGQIGAFAYLAIRPTLHALCRNHRRDLSRRPAAFGPASR